MIFKETLINTLSNENSVNNNNGFQKFSNISLDIINKHDLCMEKHGRGIQMFFLIKEVSKAIKTLNKLRNILPQSKIDGKRKRYTKQKNFCVF